MDSWWLSIKGSLWVHCEFMSWTKWTIKDYFCQLSTIKVSLFVMWTLRRMPNRLTTSWNLDFWYLPIKNLAQSTQRHKELECLHLVTARFITIQHEPSTSYYKPVQSPNPARASQPSCEYQGKERKPEKGSFVCDSRISFNSLQHNISGPRALADFDSRLTTTTNCEAVRKTKEVVWLTQWTRINWDKLLWGNRCAFASLSTARK